MARGEYSHCTMRTRRLPWHGGVALVTEQGGQGGYHGTGGV